jgi:hypothetical protein
MNGRTAPMENASAMAKSAIETLIIDSLFERLFETIDPFFINIYPDSLMNPIIKRPYRALVLLKLYHRNRLDARLCLMGSYSPEFFDWVCFFCIIKIT